MESQRVGRNDPCPCGSGRKFKQCCYSRGFAGHVAAPARHHDGAAVGLLRPPARPKPHPSRVRCTIHYKFHDGFGVGEVSYGFDRGKLFLLADRRVLRADQLTPGVEFFLEDGGTAVVTAAEPPRVWEPPPPGTDADGNSLKNVVGTVKYSGHYPVLDLRVGGQTFRTTPGHPFYSQTRRGWVDAGALRVGELLQDKAGRPVPVEGVSAEAFGYIELYNLEVEDYHTYFVGIGENAVWTHNGLRAGCRIPGPMAADALERGAISVTTRVRAGVVRPDRHHIFPQARRSWFEQRGVDIDRYTLQLDKGTHSALHYGGGRGRGGGFWNNEMMRRLLDREASLGRQLTAREILQEGARMRRDFANGFKVIHYTAP
jgi:hypothetical protein